MLYTEMCQLTRNMRKQIAKKATQQMVAMGTFFRCKSEKEKARFWKKSEHTFGNDFVNKTTLKVKHKSFKSFGWKVIWKYRGKRGWEG